MRSTKSLLWLVVLGLSPLSLHAEAKYASFPALGVEIPQPAGYIVSKQFLGLENPAKLVAFRSTPCRRRSLRHRRALRRSEWQGHA